MFCKLILSSDELWAVYSETYSAVIDIRGYKPLQVNLVPISPLERIYK